MSRHHLASKVGSRDAGRARGSKVVLARHAPLEGRAGGTAYGARSSSAVGVRHPGVRRIRPRRGGSRRVMRRLERERGGLLRARRVRPGTHELWRVLRGHVERREPLRRVRDGVLDGIRVHAAPVRHVLRRGRDDVRRRLRRHADERGRVRRLRPPLRVRSELPGRCVPGRSVSRRDRELRGRVRRRGLEPDELRGVRQRLPCRAPVLARAVRDRLRRRRDGLRRRLRRARLEPRELRQLRKHLWLGSGVLERRLHDGLQRGAHGL